MWEWENWPKFHWFISDVGHGQSLCIWLWAGLTHYCQLNRLQRTKNKENINGLKQFLMLLFIFIFFTVVTWKYFTPKFFCHLKQPASQNVRSVCTHPHRLLFVCPLGFGISLWWGAWRDYTSAERGEAKILKDQSASLHTIFMNLEVFFNLRERMLNEGQDAHGVLSPLVVSCLSWH